MARTRLTTDTATQRSVSATKADGVRQLKNAPYDKEKVEHIKNMVRSLQKSIGGLHEAVSEMTLVSSHEISPDGKLGGRGYVMPVKDFKDGLSDTLNTVSNLMDTLADELTNPNWELTPEEIQGILKGDGTVLSEETPEEPGTEGEASEGADEGLDFSSEAEEPAAEESAPAEEPAPEEAPAEDIAGGVDQELKDDLLDRAEKLSGSQSAPQENLTGNLPSPPAPGDKPGMPYEKLTRVPYEKVAMFAGRPDLDAVANALRAPILFNMFDRPTGV